jgi:hypothetical protein
MEKIHNYINGELKTPTSNQYLDNYDPSTGAIYSLIPDSDQHDVHEAVAAAREAFAGWSGLSVEKRSSFLQRIGELIDRDLDALALAESIDSGKTVALAKSLDIPRASANMRFFATGAIHFASEAHVTGAEAVNYTLRTPRRSCRLYFTMEPSLIPIHLENCARTGGWVYRCSKAFGTFTYDRFFVFKIVYRSWASKWCIKHRSWTGYKGWPGYCRAS